MNVNSFKVALSIVASLLVALVCFEMAPDSMEYKKWVSLALALISMIGCLVPALALECYDSRVTVNVKTIGWLFTTVELIVNIVFNMVDYDTVYYAVLSLLLTTMCVGVVHSIVSK